MSNGVSIALFVIVLFAMIVVHETGHFLTARAFGIKVEEFFIGFGRRIVSWRRGETEYGLKWIPLGGYVRIAGMNPWQEIPEEDLPRTFGAKPAWQRAIVLVAGSATHLIMGVVLLTFVGTVLGSPFADSTQIEAVEPTVAGAPGPAYTAGLQQGDTIVSVDGTEIGSWTQFREVVVASPGKPLEIVVERDGERRTVAVTPAAEPATDGTVIGKLGVAPGRLREPLPKAVASAVDLTGRMTVESVKGIGRIFSPGGIGTVLRDLGGEGERPADSAQGLIGIGRTAGVAGAQGGLAYLLVLFAQFIVFVGVINLAPLPPLDGGHLVLLLVEKLRGGKPVDMRKVVPVAAVVLSFLLLLTVALVYLDIARPASAPF